MAIRIKEKRKSPYEVYYRNPYTGKQEAEAFATIEEAQKKDALIKFQLKFERSVFIREEKQEKNASHNPEIVDDFMYLFLFEKQYTGKSLAWQMDNTKKFLELFADYPLVKVGAEELKSLQASIQMAGVKGTTVRHRMNAVKRFFAWCHENGHLTEMPRFPKLPALDTEKFIPPTPQELERLLAVSPPHIQRVILLGSQFGMRVGSSELFRLRWEDVELARGVIRVPAAKKNKREPWREVPIRASILDILYAWKQKDEQEGQEYVVHYDGKPVQSIKTAWNKALHRAGIQRKIRPYDLRHAFATEAISAGADVGTVAKLMGHTTPTMVLTHYQHVMDKQKKATVESLPELNFSSLCMTGIV